MTEQQIIEHIRTMADMREVDARLRLIHTMEDYLHAVQDGEKQASVGWINSSELSFPEDFENEMNSLSTDLVPVGKMLEQLSRIEAALDQQRAQILSKS